MRVCVFIEGVKGDVRECIRGLFNPHFRVWKREVAGEAKHNRNERVSFMPKWNSLLIDYPLALNAYPFD